MEHRGDGDHHNRAAAAPQQGGHVATPGWAFVAAAAPEVAQPLLGVVRGPGRGGGGRQGGVPRSETPGSGPNPAVPQPKRVLAPGVAHNGVQPHGAGPGAVGGASGGQQTNSYSLMVPRPASSLGAPGDVITDGGVYVERRPKGDAKEYEWARPAIAPRGRDGVNHDGTPLSSSRLADISGHGGDEDGGVIPPPPLLRDGGGGASVAWHEGREYGAGDDGMLASCAPGDTASRGCVPWGSQGAGDDAVVIAPPVPPPPASPGGTESLTALLASGFSCLGARARPPVLGTPPRSPGSFDTSTVPGEALQAVQSPLQSPHSMPSSPALSRSASFTSSYESLSAEAALRRVAIAAGGANTSPTGSTGGGDGSATPNKGGPGSPVFLDTATASPTSSNGGIMGVARGAVDDLHAGILRPHASGGPQPRARTRSPARLSRSNGGGWADASPKSPQSPLTSPLPGSLSDVCLTSPRTSSTASDRESVGAALKSLLTP